MNKKATKNTLVFSMLILILCMAVLIGSTFAWFTDSVTSENNVIKSGTVDVQMDWLDGTQNPYDESAAWIDAANGAIFNYEKWEPGFAQVRHIKISNIGTLALKYKLNIIANGTVSDLADVIDVFYVDPAVAVTNRADLNDSNKIGTLSDVLQNLAGDNSTAAGELLAGENVIVTLALKMQESAGNEYQNKDIGSDFSVQLLATQFGAEEDSFGNDYDKDLSLDYTPVSNINELETALANKAKSIVFTQDCYVENPISIDYDVHIAASGSAVMRANGYTGTIFNVKSNAKLTLSDIVLDGGAIWTGEKASPLMRGATNEGLVATGYLIGTEGNGSIVLEQGAILQNNDGANAVFLATRGGGSLTLNGGHVINNSSNAGAIWGGGHIYVNAGSKINGNSSTGIAGAIRMVGNCNLTVNGGELNYNKAASDGGVIWGYGSSTYTFSGGEMAYNEAAGSGGAIYTGDYSVINISGDFEMHDNKALNSGAIRLTNYTSLTMTGGKIYNNTQNGESNAFNTWNNPMNLSGGQIADNISYVGGHTLTVGMADIDGVIAFNLSTNQNTVKLQSEFEGFAFSVNESASNFNNFNLKPADGYVYTAGDEAKLVCKNEGYITYWDATTSTFRLKAK